MFRLTLASIGLAGLLSGPVLAQSAPSWEGFYGGVTVGGVYGDFKNRVPALPGPTEDSFSPIGGIHLGYNWQNGNTVIGGEADFSLLNLYGRSGGGRFEEDNMASLRFRAGVVRGRTLIFGTAGVAWTEKKTELTGIGSASDYEPGFIIGAGAERWISERWTGRVEALYVDVPKDSQNVGGVTTSGGSDNLILRLGASLHF